MRKRQSPGGRRSFGFLTVAAIAAVGSAGLVAGCKSAPSVEEQVRAEAIPVAAGKDYGRQLPPGAHALRKITDPAEIPDFRPGFDNRAGMLRAVRQSIHYLAGHPSSLLHFPSNDIGHAQNLESLRAFETVLMQAASADDLDARCRRLFDVYTSVGCDDRGTVLFTAYYRPVFEASRTPTAEFRWPLYRAPADLAVDRTPGPNLGKPLGRRLPDGAIVPYPPRGELETGPLLRNQGLELVWLRDRFDAFIIHVQGSALLKLTDGRWMTVGYAGKTDRPYKSVSQALIDDRRIKSEERSLQTLRRYFKENPAEMDRYLPVNESFVFFQENSGGPFGSLGCEVTDLHTIATDKSIYPRASVTFLQTQLPGQGGVGRLPFSGFACDQDTGGAIRAAGRCDLFLGTGEEAGKVAGHTFAEGRLYYLFLKPENMHGPTSPTQPSHLPPGGATASRTKRPAASPYRGSSTGGPSAAAPASRPTTSAPAPVARGGGDALPPSSAPASAKR